MVFGWFGLIWVQICGFWYGAVWIVMGFKLDGCGESCSLELISSFVLYFRIVDLIVWSCKACDCMMHEWNVDKLASDCGFLEVKWRWSHYFCCFAFLHLNLVILGKCSIRKQNHFDSQCWLFRLSEICICFLAYFLFSFVKMEPRRCFMNEWKRRERKLGLPWPFELVQGRMCLFFFFSCSYLESLMVCLVYEKR